jgi:hypothetical protein
MHNAFAKYHACQDAGEFTKGGPEPFQQIFSGASLCHINNFHKTHFRTWGSVTMRHLCNSAWIIYTHNRLH